MSMSTPATASPGAEMLQLMNLHDPADLAELRHQRTVCGWNYEEDTLLTWRTKMDKGWKRLFWITHTPPSPSSTTTTPIRIGHISLDTRVDPPNPSLADPDGKTLLNINTVFILPSHRHLGLARLAMQTLEVYARTEPYGSPNCKALALTVLSKRYAEDEGEDWRGIWARMGVKAPVGWEGRRARSVQEWYELLGYRKVKEEPVYEVVLLDGGRHWLVEAFMRKEL